MVTLVRIVVVVALNAVPIWGVALDEWTPGTTLALYWIQGAISIPVVAILITYHKSLTHKKGHYKTRATGATINDKPVIAHSYLASFLWISVPFVAAHGIFLALILGVFWKDKFGAVDYDDLRVGTKLLLMAMSVSFAVDMFQLGARSFAWIRARTDAVMTRSLVIHMVIIFGMALTVFTNNDPARFFNVFLVLKFLADLSSELPQWNPKKPPEALTRMAESVKKKTSGGKKGKRKDDEDFATYWARIQAEQQAGFAEDEEVMTPAQLKRFG